MTLTLMLVAIGSLCCLCVHGDAVFCSERLPRSVKIIKNSLLAVLPGGIFFLALAILPTSNAHGVPAFDNCNGTISIKTCGNALDNNECAQEVSCQACLGLGGQDRCRILGQHKFGPYPSSIQSTPEDNICWVRCSSVPCIETCPCEDQDDPCELSTECSAEVTTGCFTTNQQKWIMTGACGTGTPCDDV